jgi:hypothetical protein
VYMIRPLTVRSFRRTHTTEVRPVRFTRPGFCQVRP